MATAADCICSSHGRADRPRVLSVLRNNGLSCFTLELRLWPTRGGSLPTARDVDEGLSFVPRRSAPTLIRRAFDWLPLTGSGEMSDYVDSSSVCITDSRVFVGDTVSRVFVGGTVSRFDMDAVHDEARHRVAELSNETIAASDMVGGDRDGGRTGKLDGVPQRSSRPESDGAEYRWVEAPGLDPLAL